MKLSDDCNVVGRKGQETNAYPRVNKNTDIHIYVDETRA